VRASEDGESAQPQPRSCRRRGRERPAPSELSSGHGGNLVQIDSTRGREGWGRGKGQCGRGMAPQQRRRARPRNKVRRVDERSIRDCSAFPRPPWGGMEGSEREEKGRSPGDSVERRIRYPRALPGVICPAHKYALGFLPCPMAPTVALPACPTGHRSHHPDPGG